MPVFMNHNPLGDIYSQDSLKEYLELAKRYKLQVITDEIYMRTVFDESITFHSVLSWEDLCDLRPWSGLGAPLASIRHSVHPQQEGSL